ncbi:MULTISPECIES: GNAT family N-acetyltransferase [unclassified Exiguobacterium]|uniref:GNAT family N-acetyltransferase n=1 Tax=unclassified Exiguobacterium TaxID=2644629 RepID=UPI001BEC8DFF|nr:MULTISPECIES: GNAT family N-acetyltransferase [unclassified Exiguobacterium]
MEIREVLEFDLDEVMERQLRELLMASFAPLYPKRTFFKQTPHQRLIAFDESRVIGQVGLDYRVMNLDGVPVRVLGIIDLCVQEDERGNGVGKKLVEAVVALGERKAVDFVLLFADRDDLYVKTGFVHATNPCTWLQINDQQLTTHGIGEDTFTELMIRPVGDKLWTEGTLDFLGYLY